MTAPTARTPTTWATRVALLAALLAATALPVSEAAAGPVSGEVKLPPPRALGAPPVRNRGFVRRIANPFLETKPYDPTPFMVVVLERVDDGDASEPAREAVRFEIRGESFERPVFPVQARRPLEIKNAGSNAPVLLAPSMPDILPPEPINPGGVRRVTIEQAYQPIEIRAQGSPHLAAHLVAFPHPYFAIVDDSGKYEIPEVPAGRWRVRVWYRSGWLDAPAITIDVSSRRTTADIPIPVDIKVKAAGE
jgi:hypothetical protein